MDTGFGMFSSGVESTKSKLQIKQLEAPQAVPPAVVTFGMQETIVILGSAVWSAGAGDQFAHFEMSPNFFPNVKCEPPKPQ